MITVLVATTFDPNEGFAPMSTRYVVTDGATDEFLGTIIAWPTDINNQGQYTSIFWNIGAPLPHGTFESAIARFEANR